jgi:hypothetical protein
MESVQKRHDVLRSGRSRSFVSVAAYSLMLSPDA